jgi:hypothetical protein
MAKSKKLFSKNEGLVLARAWHYIKLYRRRDAYAKSEMGYHWLEQCEEVLLNIS